jgi:hypothetical protein
MAKAVGELRGSYDPEESTEGSSLISRRNLILGAFAALTTAGIGGGLAMRGGADTKNSPSESNSNLSVVTDSQPSNPQSNEIAAVVGDTSVNAFTRNSELYAGGRENSDPEIYRQLAENSPEELSAAFYITAEQASDPEIFSEVFADKLTAFLNTGCGYEIEDYDADSIEDFVRDMGDKYDMPTYRGLLFTITNDENGIPYTDEQLRGNDDFILFSDCHKAVLTRFAKHAFRTGNLNETISAKAISSTPDRHVYSNGHYGTTVDFQFTNDIGDNDPTKTYYDFVGENIYIPTWPHSGVGGVAFSRINDNFKGMRSLTSIAYQ